MRTGLVKYTIRRLVWTVPVIFLVTAFVYSLVHIMPGDPVTLLLPKPAQTPENIAILREELQLDRPVHEQYLLWLWDMIHGDMGTSFNFKRPVVDILKIAVSRTILLGIWAALIGIVVAIPLGVLSAVYKDTWIDNVSRVVSIGGISIPEFWMALMVILVFAQSWFYWFGYGLLPSGGYHPIDQGVLGWARHTVGPAVVLAIPYGAVIARITRSSMVDALNEEYIATARSKGLKERIVIGKHALRNALSAVITVGAYQGAAIFNGSVLAETVFNYPGLGWYVYQAALFQDYNLLMGCLIVIVFIYIGMNFFADVAYAWADPRVEYESTST